MKMRIEVAAIAFMGLGLGAARAQVPSTMAVQGVSTPTGTVTGIAAVLFNGTTIYEQSFSTTTDANGVFNVLLPNLSSATFSGDGSYALQFYVLGTTTTVPINTVPFAYHAAYADNASGLAGAAILSATQTFSGQNTFASTVTVAGVDISGYSLYLSSGLLAPNGTITAANFAGNGSQLINLNAGALTAGTVGSGILPSSVAYNSIDNNWANEQTFADSATFNAGDAATYSLGVASGIYVSAGQGSTPATIVGSTFTGSGYGLFNIAPTTVTVFCNLGFNCTTTATSWVGCNVTNSTVTIQLPFPMRVDIMIFGAYANLTTADENILMGLVQDGATISDGGLLNTWETTANKGVVTPVYYQTPILPAGSHSWCLGIWGTAGTTQVNGGGINGSNAANPNQFIVEGRP